MAAQMGIDLPRAPVIRVTTGEGMSYGPHAVGRKDGKVIFVRGGAPLEEADVILREERASFAYADVKSILRPSAVRRDAPCPYLPQCGGCPWQHLAYEAQLDAKALIVREQLRRIGRLNVEVQPILPSPQEYGYRQRLKLRVADRKVGFFAGGSHSLVPVEHCLLAQPQVTAAIPAVRELVEAIRTRITRVEITAVGEPGSGVVVIGQAEGGCFAGDKAICQRWLSGCAHVRGLTLIGHRWRREWGEGTITVRPESDLVLKVRAGSFIQVNPSANELLVATVIKLADPTPGTRVLDLYAGAGNFSLPLARRGASVLGIELDQRTAQDGTANAQRLGQENCRFQPGHVDNILGQLADTEDRFDTAILDPPRSGAVEAIDTLLHLAPARIVYASCDPATLARDLGRLASRYRVDCVQPIDLFPQTYHIETVALATLTGP